MITNLVLRGVRCRTTTSAEGVQKTDSFTLEYPSLQHCLTGVSWGAIKRFQPLLAAMLACGTSDPAALLAARGVTDVPPELLTYVLEAHS